MLAKATAASAGVPLLYCSGSDFVEVFVGRGAARVRNLFERASKMAPCIIFVDELDALGKSRDFGNFFSSRGGGGGNDEAEQTLNQLLACMDGLDSSRRICVMAATNRKNVLDPALIRPGRFDRIVTLTLPDAAGREKILRVHCQKLPGFVEQSPGTTVTSGTNKKDAPVDLRVVALLTDGFSGAELESLVNEAAIRAVRRVSVAVEQRVELELQQQQQQGQQDTASVTSIQEDSIVPQVLAVDFDASIDNFYASRGRGRRRWGISTAGAAATGGSGGGLFPPLGGGTN